MGTFVLTLVLVPFLDPRRGLLRILGLEGLGHRLKVVIVKVEVEMP